MSDAKNEGGTVEEQPAVLIFGVDAEVPPGKSFIHVGNDNNITISDCTIFGKNPSLRVLLRSWWRRQHYAKAGLRSAALVVLVGLAGFGAGKIIAQLGRGGDRG